MKTQLSLQEKILIEIKLAIYQLQRLNSELKQIPKENQDFERIKKEMEVIILKTHSKICKKNIYQNLEHFEFHYN